MTHLLLSTVLAAKAMGVKADCQSILKRPSLIHRAEASMDDTPPESQQSS